MSRFLKGICHQVSPVLSVLVAKLLPYPCYWLPGILAEQWMPMGDGAACAGHVNRHAVPIT